MSADCLVRSVRDIVSFYLQFQGIRVSDYCPAYPAMICSDHALTTIRDRVVKRVSKYMELGSVSLFASSRPQSHETSSWLIRRGMGYYGPILAVHDISSLQQFSVIDVSSANMSSLIADAAAVSGRTIVNEALRLQTAVREAKRDQKGQGCCCCCEGHSHTDSGGRQNRFVVLQVSLFYSILPSQ